jgi:hypothetical protein
MCIFYCRMYMKLNNNITPVMEGPSTLFTLISNSTRCVTKQTELSTVHIRKSVYPMKKQEKQKNTHTHTNKNKCNSPLDLQKVLFYMFY